MKSQLLKIGLIQSTDRSNVQLAKNLSGQKSSVSIGELVKTFNRQNLTTLSRAVFTNILWPKALHLQLDPDDDTD